MKGPRRRRVLVIGGGCGGMAAAWALSRGTEERRAYDVTLLQPGWRLGGKGATGRDLRRGARILEHGLHLWLGFYRTAFGMMKDVYDSWDRPSHGPLRSLETAFSPLLDVVLAAGGEDRLELWPVRCPPLPGRPWDPPSSLSDAPRTLAASIAWLRSVLAGDAFGDDPSARRLRQSSELASAIGRGLLLDVGPARGGDFAARWSALDAHDLRAWLRRHGASEAVADSPPVRALYDLGFAYPDGRSGAGRGAVAAGAALGTLLKIFGGYRGAPFWRMNAGMGDTVFAPMYEVLRERGVRFQFFHRLERLRLDPSGRAIASVDVGVQAAARGGYRPLVPLDDARLRVWPDQPRGDQLDEVAAGDLEADDGPVIQRRTWTMGEDFDFVVLAVPSTVHRRFASELMEASPRYRRMVENTHAVPTIAAQWWLSRRPSSLGWAGTPPVLTGLPGLLRTWADMSEVLDAEAWPQRPAGVAYFCNVAPPELFGETDRAAGARFVADRVRAWAAREGRTIWPNASDGRGGFDDGALFAPHGEEPWAYQYARANVAGWERYVLSLPGTIQHRLGPAESGFENLLLAGDWTRNVINGGSVEGAVSSGVEAAHAILERS
jgi:uncharacterized protein with NAD-binding domain and iron-sulfur cluster